MAICIYLIRLAALRRPLCKWSFAGALVLSQLASLPVFAQGDSLGEPALESSMAQHSMLLDIDRAGERLVAVGERGHILLSDDGAKSWRQAQVPVRVTLTSSFFINDRLGWAVGHDGVVLKTNDGGQQWHKLLDGIQANQLILEHAQQVLIAKELRLESATDAERETLEIELEHSQIHAEDASTFLDEGASRPFLGVWFNNENEGYVVGAFGMFLHTRNGGESWTCIHERLDNPDGFHLNGINKIGDLLFIIAEAGGIYRSDDDGQSWEFLDTPYRGSFFGITGDGQGLLIAYGLRGNAYASPDNGNSWQKIDTGTQNSLLGSTRLDDGSTLLLGSGGVMVHVDTQGQILGTTTSSKQLPISAAVNMGTTGIVTAGIGGVQTHATVTVNGGIGQ